MDLISLFLIEVIVFFVAVYFSIRHASKPKKCPKCGSYMDCYFDKENDKIIYECKCGFKS